MLDQKIALELKCCNVLCSEEIIKDAEIVYFPENHTIYHKKKECIHLGYTYEFMSGRKPQSFDIISRDKAIELKREGKINEPEKE
jgi:hypothetical protein